MTWREEIIGDARLILGDCREVLPTLGPVDAVVTDPVWPNMPAGMFPIDDAWKLFADAMALLPKLRQLVVCLRSDSDPRFLQGVPRSLRFQQVVWCQYVVPGYAGRVLGGNETAYVFGEPIPFAPGQQVIPSMTPKAQPHERPMQQGELRHPCPRTLRHQEFLMRWFTIAGEVVLDPFMGSGTAGVAAFNFGRPFIGIEINEEYFDIAYRRIEEAWKQPRLFDEPRVTPQQAALEFDL